MADKDKPDIIDRLGDMMERNHSRPAEKIGAGHAAGMLRLGFKEFAQVIPAFNDGIRPIEEPGLAGNITNIEVVRDKEQGAAEPKPAYRVEAVSEIGPPQATPSIKGQAVPQRQRDPLAEAKERAQRQEPSKGKEVEI